MIFDTVTDWRAALPGYRALIGLDHGRKTIGVAVSDAGWTIATPLVALQRGRFREVVAGLRPVIDERGAGGLVVGLPINMDGTEGPRCQAARAFATNLVDALGLPLLLWDERWSTRAVTRTLLEADLSRRKRRGVVDKMAAAYILQGVLDAMPPITADAS